MVQVPVDGQHDALLEGSFGVPAQIVLDLGGIDTIAAVVTQTVGDVLDELLADALVLQTVVQLVDDGLDDVFLQGNTVFSISNKFIKTYYNYGNSNY